MASRAVLNQTKDFINLANDSGISLKKVLFGSYDRNKQTKYSDIDLALVADEFIGVPSEDVKLFLKVLRKYYMIQPQTYNTKDFSEEVDRFVGEILRECVVIKG